MNAKKPGLALFSILILLFLYCPAAYSFERTVSIMSGGKIRDFKIYAPGATPANNLPVLFVFHGDNSDGASIEGGTGFDAIADAGNFLVVYPDADSEGWNRAIDQTKDTQFTSDMIDYLCSTYYINAKRVYATGVSAGGFMTYNLAVNLPGKVAAFAPISGNMYATNGNTSYFASSAFKPVAICHIHGSLDLQVPYPDPDNQPTPWQEWPLTQFSYYTCHKDTYTFPNVTIAEGVTKLTFCVGNPPDVKELSLISVAGKAHESLVVPGFNPYQAAWNFVKDYSISNAQSCAAVVAEGVIHSEGKDIVSPCNEVFIPRGVNYSLADDWEFPANMNGDPTHVNDELSAEIIKAKPNTVRIQWYVNRQAGWKTYSVADLDMVITRFRNAGIVSIIDLHDVTCSNDYSKFNSTILPWWKQQSVLTMLNKHRGFVMANLANEFGYVNWTANQATAYTTWLNHYKNAISELRAAGIEVPLMIDAPDCGQNLDVVLQAGGPLKLHDPLKNVIMSVHSYWYQNSAADMETRTQQIATATFPIVFGEIANIQDATGQCSDPIPAYANLLQSCQNHGVGWLAWTWTDDWCQERRVAPNGNFSALSTYGDKIVNDPNFGLMTHAEKISCLSNPLPVRLISFEASRSGEHDVNLDWRTSHEDAFRAFDLERSNDGRNFIILATIKPTAANSYYYLDKNVLRGTNYYRLKMVDSDDSYAYSRVVSVNAILDKTIRVYPSPAFEFITIDSDRQIFPQKVVIVDQSGRRIITQLVRNSGDKIYISEVNEGVYSVIMNDEVVGKVIIGKR